MEKKSNECTGECCASFTLYGGAEERFALKDDEVMKNMLTLIGKDVFNASEYPAGEEEIYANQYNHTCKFWDRETKLCTVYDKRPQMCSEYPYDGICGTCGMVGPKVENVETATVVWCCTMHRLIKEGKLSELR
jgi:Fe-S-cluster containining protein